MSLTDRRVFITGASSGIGEQLAVELTSRGAAVGLLARRDERLRELASRLEAAGGVAAWARADVTDGEGLAGGREAAGGVAAWARADVTDGEGLAAACDELVASLGEPDVVVANAGYNRPESARSFKPGRAQGIYETNLLGFLRLVDWALPRFLERGSGHLVGIASVASYFGFPGHAGYCGSKAAMRVHLQSLRPTLRRRGIAVTTICPGFVVSELTAKNEFPMPFMWPTERAARVIVRAIEKRRGEVVFPWQMRLLVTFGLARLVPRALAERLLSRAG